MSPSPANKTKIEIKPSDVGLPNPIKTIDGDTMSNLLGILYFFAGVVAVIVIIVGGIRYVASNGDSSQIQSAKNTVTYAVIGLVVVIMAAAITQFVITNVN